VKTRILKWAWDIITVSLAAQLSTAPLVAYYFHQLPAYSVLTSLVAIPLLSCMITIFTLSVPLLAAGMLINPVSWLLAGLASVMNRTMEFIGSLPGAVIGNLHTDIPSTVLLLVMIFTLTGIMHRRSGRGLISLLLISAIFLGRSSIGQIKVRRNTETVIAHFYGGSLITFMEGNHVDHYILYWDDKVRSYMQQYLEVSWGKRIYMNKVIPLDGKEEAAGSVTSMIPLSRGIRMVGNDMYRGLILLGSADLEGLERVEGLENLKGLEHLEGLDTDFILLSGEPRIRNLKWLAERKACPLILDGSNRSWYSRQFTELNHPHHITSVDGAYRTTRQKK
jgi:hypothetical protein